MGTIISKTFDLELSNTPIIDLRKEFNDFYELLKTQEFRNKFSCGVKPIETPRMLWQGMPDDLLNLIVLRAIIGIEAFLPSAVFFELGGSDRLSPKNLELIENPYLLNGKGTAENYYHRLPKLVDLKHSLKQSDNPLWEKTRKFYSEVRNKIFHGYQINNCPDGVLKCYEHIAKLYNWIDSWHTPPYSNISFEVFKNPFEEKS